jgi:hypothetical protein
MWLLHYYADACWRASLGSVSCDSRLTEAVRYADRTVYTRPVGLVGFDLLECFSYSSMTIRPNSYPRKASQPGKERLAKDAARRNPAHKRALQTATRIGTPRKKKRGIPRGSQGRQQRGGRERRRRRGGGARGRVEVMARTESCLARVGAGAVIGGAVGGAVGNPLTSSLKPLKP